MIPCSLIARYAQKFSGSVTLQANGRVADATSVLDLLTLKASCGAVVTLEARGDDAAALVDELERMFENNFPLPEKSAVSSPVADERSA